MKKGTVIDTMNDLPEKFELDELIEKLLLVEKVEKGSCVPEHEISGLKVQRLGT